MVLGIREFDRRTDMDGIRACLLELQDFERQIDSRVPAGEEIAEAYIQCTLSQCEEFDGTIIVADLDGEIAGYAAIFSHVQSGEIDDGNQEFAYVADLIVRTEYRSTGLGRSLMAGAESYARDRGAKWLRVCARAQNGNARRLYQSSGFRELYIDFEKELATTETMEKPLKQSLALTAVVVRDYDEAIGFYTAKLGFSLIEDLYIPEQDKRWVVVSPRGATESQILLARASNDEQSSRVGNQTGGRVFLFLYTDDFWRDYRTYVANGVEFVREPKDEAYGTVAVFRDLYGNLWDLVQPASRRT